MTDELRVRLTNIIAGDDFPVYEHLAKADLIIEVVEAPLRARIAELEAALRPFAKASDDVADFAMLGKEELRPARAALEKKNDSI